MRTLIRDIGAVVSGDVRRPLIATDAVLIADGRIATVGGAKGDADVVIDARGTTLAPGFWDGHHHPYFGEYSPRGEAFNTMSKTVRAGTVCLVSAGAAHQPGMYLPSQTLPNVQALAGARGIVARDALGTKALAIVSAAAWGATRPLGLKVHAETVIAEPGLGPDDFRELAAAGVRRLKFLRPIPSRTEARDYVSWAHDNGMLVMTHTGGRSLIADGATIDESIRMIAPDIACHVNGGPTPPPPETLDWLIEESQCALDLVFHGNLLVARRVIERTAARDQLGRVFIGSDSPSEGGVNPGAIMRFVTILAGMTNIAPAVLFAMATGNTARAFALEGGRIEPGQPADLVLWDPMDGSVTADALGCVAYGDRIVPGIVMIDGIVRVHADVRSIAPKRVPVVSGT